ncbi:MAG: hypothetical protein HQK89_04785 [Nitrospirae bacterium]|nr:hypothetical protein [Nitrospirota bacterium]
MPYSIYALMLLAAGAVACVFLDGREKLAARVCLVIVLAGSLLIAVDAVKVLSGGVPPSVAVDLGVPMGIARFEVDGLTALFLCLIAGLSTVCALYAQGAMAPYFNRSMRVEKFFFFYILLVASLVVAAMARNVIVFLTALEVMTLASFFLILFDHGDDGVRRSAVSFMVYMHIGLLLVTAALLIGVAGSGTMDLSGITTHFKPHLCSNGGSVGILFPLLFVGFGFIAGFVPLHLWPVLVHGGAYGGAYGTPSRPVPAPMSAIVSAILSGLVANMGIYGILRVVSLAGGLPLWIGYALFFVSVVSGFYGIINALAQHDIRRLLAYVGIGNIGITGAGISVGLIGLSSGLPQMAALGLSGALLHMVNYTVFTGLLFCGAGSIGSAVHTNDVNLMGGLIKRMPFTGFAFLVGVMSVCGLPPFNGFISEFIIYGGIITGFNPSMGLLLATLVPGVAALALIEGLSVLVFAKIFGIAFLGECRSSGATQSVESPKTMVAAMMILCAVSLFTGLMPTVAVKALQYPLSALHAGLSGVPPGGIASVAGDVSMAVIVFLSITGGLLLLRLLALKRAQASTAPVPLPVGKRAGKAPYAPPEAPLTWFGGYEAVNPAMQYTVSSFNSPLCGIAGSRMCGGDTEGSALGTPGKTLPLKETSSWALFYPNAQDFFEGRFYLPLWRAVERVLGKFSRIESGHKDGRIGNYLLYMLSALIILLILLVVYTWNGGSFSQVLGALPGVVRWS